MLEFFDESGEKGEVIALSTLAALLPLVTAAQANQGAFTVTVDQPTADALRALAPAVSKAVAEG